MSGNRRRGLSSFTDGRVAVPVLAAVLGLAACSDGSAVTEPRASSSTPATERSPTSTTSTEATTIEDEIAARYQAFWEARFEASKEPVNPDHAGLHEYATGSQLENVVAETRERQEEGVAFRRPEPSVAESSVRVTEVAADKATVQECAVDDTVVYRIATGEVVDDDVMTFNVEATMQRVEGNWRLASARRLQQWEGVAGCALADDF